MSVFDRRPELLHLLLFLLICTVAFFRANLEDFYEEEVYVRGEIVGDMLQEGEYIQTKIRITESEIEDIEGRKALLKVYGHLPTEARHISLIGDVRVTSNRVFIYASSQDVEIMRVEKSLRDFLMERYINNSKDRETTSLGLSFLFGQERELLPSDVQRDFLKTGLVHLLVISGLHIGIIAFLLSYMLPRFWGLKLALVGVLLYSLLIVPAEPPVVRATLMAVLFILSLLSFQPPNSLSILLFSGTLILIAFPHFVFSYSFWLSFVATAYIFLSLKDFEGGRWLKTLLASLSAFTGVSPLIGTFSGISPISVLLTPLLSPIVMLYSFMGILSLVTLMSFPPFVDIFNLAGRVFRGAVELLSGLSFEIYPSLGNTEAVLVVALGAGALYFLKGYSKLAPLLSINAYMLIRSF